MKNFILLPIKLTFTIAWVIAWLPVVIMAGMFHGTAEHIIKELREGLEFIWELKLK